MLDYVMLKDHPYIKVKGVEHKSTLELILEDLGAKHYQPGISTNDECWLIPALRMNYRELVEVDESTSNLKTMMSKEVPTLRYGTLEGLHDFQQEAISHALLTRLPGVLFALSPGLGKSAVCASLLRIKRPRSLLIVAPLILIDVWLEQLELWGKVYDLPVVTRNLDPVPEMWNLTTYETIQRRYREYAKHPWDVLIVDESSKIRNRKTVSFRALQSIRKNARTVWLLSGSPVSQDVSDLWAQFNLIWPEAFKSFWRFAGKYCFLDVTPWGTSIRGSRPFDFVDLFSDLMFTRQQVEVLPNLPNATFELHEMPLTIIQRTLFDTALKSFILDLESGQIPIQTRLAQMTYLQEIVSNPVNIGGENISSKQDALLELVSRIEFPLLIWVHWRKGAEVLFERLKSVYRTALILGGDSEASEKIQEYKNGKYEVLILSLGVGKFGLTLTNTKTIIYFDKTFEMESYLQSFYRVLGRIGLEHSPHVISLKCTNTTDELVEQNLTGKAIDINRITNEDLVRLLRSLSR